MATNKLQLSDNQSFIIEPLSRLELETYALRTQLKMRRY